MIRALLALMMLVGSSTSLAGSAFAQSATPAADDTGGVTGAEPMPGSTVSFTVAMSDSSAVPSGLSWTLYPDGSWTAVQEGPVPAGASPVAVTLPNLVDYGRYSLWITGGGYSSGQTIVVEGETFHHDFVLDPLPTPTTEPTMTPTDEPTLTPTSEPTATTEPTATSEPTATLAPNTALGSFTVAMRDGGDLPAGLTWTLYPGDSWTPLQSGPVPAGPGPVAIPIPNAVPFGSYGLWITGAGYSSGQAITVSGPSFHHDFVLDRLTGTLTIAVTTTHGADIPAGTTWSLEVAEPSGAASGYTGAQSGTLATALPNGSTLPIENPVEFGTYTLTIDAPGYEPYSTTVDHTNVWVPDTSITAELVLLSSEVSLGVTMNDGGDIPPGLTWTLYPGDSWTPLQSGPVTDGDPAFSATLPEPVEYGTYQLWITGAGYSSGQVIVVDAPTFHHDFVLDRLSGGLTVTVTTSNGSAVPAGTTWSLEFSGVGAAAVFGPQNGTLDADLPSGSPLPIQNPVEYGSYTLTIDAPGFAPYSSTIEHTDPWSPDTSVTAELQALESEVSLGVTMSDNGPIPAGLTWTLYPAGSWEPLQLGEVTAGNTSFTATLPEAVPYGVYQLWITGNGYSSGQVIVVDAPSFRHDFVLDRLIGSISVFITTSDGSDIPAGAAWQLAGPMGDLVTGGTVETPFVSGGLLVSVPDLEYGPYLFEMHAPGYEAIARSIEHTDPWNADTVVTYELVLIPVPTPTPGSTETVVPTATATATASATTPAPTATSVATATGTPNVTTLPKTGQGPDSGMGGPAVLLMLAIGMTLLAVAIRRTPARRR